jgi:hypothetical protein
MLRDEVLAESPTPMVSQDAFIENGKSSTGFGGILRQY